MNSSLITDYSSHITPYPKVSIIILNWNGLEDTIDKRLSEDMPWLYEIM